MALDDFVESEVGIAVAATALLVSPEVRNVVRRGLVYGLAAVLKASDTVATAARSVAGDVQQSVAAGGPAAEESRVDVETVRKRTKNT